MVRFLCGCDAADAHVRAIVVVCPEPLCGEVLCLLDSFNDVLVEPLVPDRAVVAFDVGVLLRLAGLDMLQEDVPFAGPFLQLLADVFRPVINPDGTRRASPLDDPVEAADHPLGGQREVHLDAQSLAVEVVQYVQQPERSAVLQPVGHEVHRPHQVRARWHRQHVRLVPLQPLSRLDPQVQFQFPVDAVDPFVVPAMTLHVAQIQEAQTKSPRLLRIGQPDQQIGDPRVLIA